MLSSLSNIDPASARASSVLPTPVGPRKMNEPIGPLRVLQPGPRADDRVGHGLHRFVLTDNPVVQNRIELEQLLLLALKQARDGHAGPAGDHFRDLVRRHFLLHEARAPFVVLARPRPRSCPRHP